MLCGGAHSVHVALGILKGMDFLYRITLEITETSVEPFLPMFVFLSPPVREGELEDCLGSLSPVRILYILSKENPMSHSVC